MDDDPYEIPDGMDAILVPDGIAPEDNVSTYLENAYDKYNKIKTLRYNDAPRKSYTFYVCNNDITKKSISKNIPAKQKPFTMPQRKPCRTVQISF